MEGVSERGKELWLITLKKKKRNVNPNDGWIREVGKNEAQNRGC